VNALRVRRAVIDVGTNSVKLLVAEVEGDHIWPILEKSEQTRLGQGFYDTHQLQPDAIAHTARAVASFVEEARALQASHLCLFATSAARDALNQDELADAVERRARLPLTIITGEQEAEWAFHGVRTDPNLAKALLLILDVGGGSTQMVVGEKGHHSFRQSFPMGSVRLLEKLRPADPPTLRDLAGCRAWLADYFNHEIGPALESLAHRSGRKTMQLVGTGGTATILARMELKMNGFDRDRIDGLRLTRRQVLDWTVHLWSLPLLERKSITGLPANRADVILMGVAIYEAVLAHFDLGDVYVSTRGLRFGALLGSSTGCASS
jgi:exopolyphosphatase/guanosine-5'-triphosphate,3'-diphosphate pyrophosphatase